MTESREPISLPPRRPAATPQIQNLRKANREAAAPAAPPAAEVPSKRRPQVTFYMDAASLKRAKAAYRATSGQEMDDSWSDFLSRAIMNEVARRERLYNQDQPFAGGSGKLAPGRKPNF